MLSKILLVLILLIIDWYSFQAIKVVTSNRPEPAKNLIYIIFWSITIFSILIIVISSFKSHHFWPKMIKQYVFSIIFIIYFSKILVVPFLLLDDLIRLFRWVVSSVVENKSEIGEKVSLKTNSQGISRIEFLNYLGLSVAAIPFVSMIYGMLKGPYEFKVRKIKLSFPNLPIHFNGLKVLHLSDIHIGSFNSPVPLIRAIDLIKEQKPDVIFFTGDLVNERADEMDCFIHILKEIQAPLGVFSVMGNHDYGDYHPWPNAYQKNKNSEKFKTFHQQLGWKLLLNKNILLEKENEKIAVIGVENWSAYNRFIKYGNMESAIIGTEEIPFKILLSHDPSHWNSEIIKKYTTVDLTLSGHTHGMQFGVDIPGFKWSPVQYVYKQWAGLYQHKIQYLYVNRGLGFIGYPGRVGIMPEIAVIELNKA